MSDQLIAFGDTHGCYKAAAGAICLAEDLGAKAIFLGDYVDRGPSAVGVINALMEAREKHPDWVFLRGNHDQMLLDLIEGRAKPEDQGIVLGMGFDYAQSSKSLDEWHSQSVDGRNSILSFLNDTGFFYETDHYIFCHAVLRNTNQGITEKAVEELMWNYESDPPWEAKCFVHGHDPVEQPVIGKWGINVNTRCGYGGELTGIHISRHGDPLAFYAVAENGTGLRSYPIDGPLT